MSARRRGVAVALRLPPADDADGADDERVDVDDNDDENDDDAAFEAVE